MATEESSITDVPTYGDLIDLYEECEDCVNATDDSISVLLFSKFKFRYPNVPVSRPKRLHDAVSRIVAPTRSSLRGPSKLSGTELLLYRSKQWTPRITVCCKGHDTTLKFPVELASFGLDEELLIKVFHQAQSNQHPLSWCVRGIPDCGFSQDLHEFLKSSPHTRNSSKASIGKFYICIDGNLKRSSFQPIEAYCFVEKCPKYSTTSDSGQPDKGT